MIIRALTVWGLLALLAIANGAVRNAAFTPRFGDYAGHVISTMVLCALIFLVSWSTIDWIGPSGMGQSGLIGAVWVLSTVAFEFLAGHFLFGQPWERLKADYNVLRGRVWVLVLIATLVAPVWAARVRDL